MTTQQSPSETARDGGVPRVAFVLAELRPGGMERVVIHLATEMPRLGIAPLIVCLERPGALAYEAPAAGVRLTAIGSTRGRDIRGLFRLARTLRRFRPSVINVHDYASLPYVALARYLGARAPTVFTAHGLLYEGFEGLQKRHRRAARCLSGLMAVSEPVAERHREYVGWQGDIPVVRNGVPDVRSAAAERTRVRGELGIGEDETVFVAVGNARPEKGFEDLLSAAAAMRQECRQPRWRVLVAGKMDDGPYVEALRQQHSEAGLQDSVLFLGFRSDVPALYAAADVFVLSSRSEGLPMVLLEAMTAGLPVVATRVGGVPEAVPQAAGVLVPPAEPDRLAEAMSALASDAHRRSAMGAAAREHALKQYGVERMAREYLDVFSRVVAKRDGA